MFFKAGAAARAGVSLRLSQIVEPSEPPKFARDSSTEAVRSEVPACKSCSIVGTHT